MVRRTQIDRPESGKKKGPIQAGQVIALPSQVHGNMAHDESMLKTTACHERWGSKRAAVSDGHYPDPTGHSELNAERNEGECLAERRGTTI